LVTVLIEDTEMASEKVSHKRTQKVHCEGPSLVTEERTRLLDLVVTEQPLVMVI
jgi:hypothetical protein